MNWMLFISVMALVNPETGDMQAGDILLSTPLGVMPSLDDCNTGGRLLTNLFDQFSNSAKTFYNCVEVTEEQANLISQEQGWRYNEER